MSACGIMVGYPAAHWHARCGYACAPASGEQRLIAAQIGTPNRNRVTHCVWWTNCLTWPHVVEDAQGDTIVSVISVPKSAKRSEATQAKGAYLDGGKAYKLTVLQPVPAKLFWSVTVYDPDSPLGPTGGCVCRHRCGLSLRLHSEFGLGDSDPDWGRRMPLFR